MHYTGQPMKRVEDPHLVTGKGSFVDDVQLPDILHAAVLRSPHAHARIKRIDTARAKTAPGVIAVYTGDDTEGSLNSTPCAWLVPNSNLKVAAYPSIAKDIVRYVGDIVAAVVAETPYQATDALDLIQVDYEPLPSVIDPEKSAQAGSPQSVSRSTPAMRSSAFRSDVARSSQPAR